MTRHALEFYDPLYELISISSKYIPPRVKVFSENTLKEEATYKEIKYIKPDPIAITQSKEFVRLARLKQSGLSWLVFPSATHTRYAHSIGCWRLGNIAESQIKIIENDSDSNSADLLKGNIQPSPAKFYTMLDRTGLREEFLLSLLLHDIGHGPLGHTIEDNEIFLQGLVRGGLKNTDHEHRGASLIIGEGELARAWKSKSDCSDLPLLQDLFANASKGYIDVMDIAYIMTGDENTYLSEETKRGSRIIGLRILKELVSGILDLDRLDHYARDSFFSGIKQVVVNVYGFLNGVRIGYDENQLPKIILTEEGASHAASLLFNKRQLISTMFRNSQVLSYSAMVNWALSCYLSGLPNNDIASKSLEIALMDDDEFIKCLVNKEAPGSCRDIMKHICNISPYMLVGAWPDDRISSEWESVIDNFRDKYELSFYDGNEAPCAIIHKEKGFGYDKKTKREASDDWLNTDKLYLQDGRTPLTDHPKYQSDFEHLRVAGKNRFIWCFAKNKDKVKQCRDYLVPVLGIPVIK